MYTKNYSATISGAKIARYHCRQINTALLLLISSVLGYSQSTVWSNSVGGINFDYSCSVLADAQSNVYTIGHFQGTIDFDPGSGIYNLTSQGYNDVFIMKVDAHGNFIWVKSMGGIYDENVSGASLDNYGNICITGYYIGSADFDPGVEVYNLISKGKSDAFVTKLDSEGNLIWAKSTGGINGDFAYAIALDNIGNLFITGA